MSQLIFATYLFLDLECCDFQKLLYFLDKISLAPTGFIVI